MSDSTTVNVLLDAMGKVLLRCWIFGFLVLLGWFAAVTLAGDLVYGVHGSMFDLTRSQLSSIHYCGMGFLKLFVGIFFFFPWISIRLVLNKSKG